VLGWPRSARRESRRLVRDAAAIVESTRRAAPPPALLAVADDVRRSLEEAHARGGPDPARYAPIVDHFRMLHRDARRRRDDDALTAHTLVIIYLRAEMLGEEAAAARRAIDAFLGTPAGGPDDA